MAVDFTICTFVTPSHLNKLQWTLPTWPSKLQFKDRPIIIFHHGFTNDNKIAEVRDLNFVKEYFSNWTFVNWHPSNTDSIRELVFSAYYFGLDYVKTPYFVKIDADCFFTSDRAIWEDSDSQFDIVSNPWGYTKPGWWVDYLENVFCGTKNVIDRSDPKTKHHPRMISHCCLHRTDFMREMAKKMNGKLPVPSHDTTASFFVEKFGKMKTRRLEPLGVNVRTNWKSIREWICSNDLCSNKFLDSELMSHVQLEITTHCQLRCFNCDRNCGIAPSKEEMDIPQIWKFIDESLTMEKEWKRIDIIGGEPTLHQDLYMILKMIEIYKKKYPRCTIRFSTNGLGEKTQKILKTIPEWVVIRNSEKEGREQTFTAYNSAPIDNGEKETKSCSIPWRCGIGLTRYGYFLCGAGASIARVFGLDIGIKYLAQVSPQKLLSQRQVLCQLCGHSQVKSRHLTNKEELSKSWIEARKIYTNKRLGMY